MGFGDYRLRTTIEQLNSIVYNATQGNTYSKYDILNSLIRIIENYNKTDLYENKIVIRDFRNNIGGY